MTKKTLFISKALLSLTGTPWLILLSTSIPLYMANREDLNHQVSVLLPFVGLMIASIVLASVFLLIAIRRDHSKTIRRLLWGYYFLGWLFTFFVALHHMEANLTTKMGLMLLAAVLTAYLCVVLENRVQLVNAVGFWALVSTALILADLYESFISPAIDPGRHSEASAGKESPATGKPEHAKSDSAPNVYHFVLDEFQTDMFTLGISGETVHAFAGFTFFPETTTWSGRTDMSIPSVFSGLDYDFNSRQFDYQKSAFNGSSSFLYWLKERGYETYAYIHPMWAFELGLFDHVKVHEAPRQFNVDSLDKAFLQLWFFAHLPTHLSRRLIDKVDFEQLTSQNTLPATAPLMSYHTMQQILSKEDDYADSNRYTFAHIILPHIPYVMNEDCSYDPERHTATPLSQSRCAIKLMSDFIAKLKELDRFSDSLIIIQSDHGARFEVKDNRLVSVEGKGLYSIPWSTARSRTLLLIKPPGVPDDTALKTSHFKASLLDVAPTVNQALGLNMTSEFSGFDLFSPPDDSEERVRYYHFYDKKGRGGWTDEMTRYRISNSILSLEGSVSLTNNEPGA